MANCMNLPMKNSDLVVVHNLKLKGVICGSYLCVFPLMLPVVGYGVTCSFGLEYTGGCSPNVTIITCISDNKSLECCKHNSESTVILLRDNN